MPLYIPSTLVVNILYYCPFYLCVAVLFFELVQGFHKKKTILTHLTSITPSLKPPPPKRRIEVSREIIDLWMAPKGCSVFHVCRIFVTLYSMQFLYAFNICLYYRDYKFDRLARGWSYTPGLCSESRNGRRKCTIKSMRKLVAIIPSISAVPFISVICELCSRPTKISWWDPIGK